jgi:hypothetical protein
MPVTTRFARIAAFSLLALASVAGVAAFVAAGQPAGAAPAPTLPTLPRVTCNFTVLNFNLAGTGVVGASRPLSVTAGDNFAQFIAPPITATITSTAAVIVGNGYTGGVSGGVNGTFVLTNVNGVLVTDPEGSAGVPRGFQLHTLAVNGASGTITAAMGLNFVALSNSPPYFPRAINGYLHSVETSGAYAPYRYNGVINGTIIRNLDGSLLITASVVGRLYSGGGNLSEFLGGSRSQTPNRATAFSATDVIAQFRSPDFTVGTASGGHVNPATNFLGGTSGTINGGFALNHNALLVDAGFNAGKGWLAGEFTFSDANGELLTGPWLSDVNQAVVKAYLWQAAGTGIYTDSLLFGVVTGTISFGGALFDGTMTGVYCDGSVIPTPTLTRTPGPSITRTPGPSITATFTRTYTPTPPATTATATPTATPTLCAITFSDVHPGDYFYEAVRYLYCRAAISGYADGTFRPYNNTTRAQLCKIVVLAEQWPINTVGGPHFTDVPVGSAFYDYIETAFNRGVISGYADGTFRPGSDVTRGQLCKIIVSAEGWPSLH